MSMGAYDEDEHERRERKNGQVDVSEADDRSTYEGEVEYEDSDTETLLEQFQDIKSD
jgi:hypothetical protein